MPKGVRPVLRDQRQPWEPVEMDSWSARGFDVRRQHQTVHRDELWFESK